MAGPRKHAVIVGAGLGGLATALRLLEQGLEVTVLERRAEVGGTVGQIREAGFSFDAGPASITMPWVLEELFQAAGAKVGERLRLSRLEPSFRVCWHGEQRSFLFNSDRASMIEQIAQFSAQDARNYDAFLEAGRALYERGFLALGRQACLHPGQYLRLLRSLRRLGALRSLDQFLARFFREPHVRQAFSLQSLFCGSDPFRGPALYAALAYATVEQGVWYPAGGVHTLARELCHLVQANGGKVVTGRRVTRILVTLGRARGVRTDRGEEVQADVVVSSADPITTQVELLKRMLPRLRSTVGCFLLHLGVGCAYPELCHQTLLVGPDFRDFIRDVGRRYRLPRSLLLSVQAPSRTDRSLAPEHGEAITVAMPVPNLQARLDWPTVGEKLRERMLEELESPQGLGLPGVRRHLAFEARWTPQDFRDQLGAWQGNAFSVAPTRLLTSFLRVPKRDRKVKGVYYAGAGTQPGAGVPAVLLGAALTAGLIGVDLSSWGSA